MTQKPIYAIMSGEVRKVVERYEIGFGALPDNIEDIARGFLRFLGLSSAEKERMSQSATTLLSNVFNRQQIIEKINSYVWDRYE